MKIYVASSWRNDKQPEIVEYLRLCGYDVYDFKNPEVGDHGFHWSEIDENWKDWSPSEFRHGLGHQLAHDGFMKDMTALTESDVVVLVQPCGISAHLELGWACGSGKFSVVLLEKGEPELMYKMANALVTSPKEILPWLSEFSKMIEKRKNRADT